MDKMKLIESKFIKKDIPKFNIGDTLKVFVKIPEGPDKIRLHPFEGVVIAKNGEGVRESFTLRKISYGEGIERLFSVNSPSIERIEVMRSGDVKRAKLYYLRAKIGKRATKIKEKKEK
ncbi:MAG: 50S ribosomal protein L19 [Candidatus Omnitrophota bacterium]